MEEGSSSIENRRTRRRREKRDSKERQEAHTPGRSSASGKITRDQTNTKPEEPITFEEGGDYIPFLFPEVSDEESGRLYTKTSSTTRRRSSPSATPRGLTRERPWGSHKGKEKAEDHDIDDLSDGELPDRASRKATDRERGGATARERSRERVRDRERDRDHDKERDRIRDRDRDRTRDRNDERERSGSKRKYEMIFDPEDGYANKKQRIDASSRKAPWVSGLKWDRCNNVAEMLHQEVEAFVHWISPTPVEDEVRGCIISLISKAVTSAFPDARVHAFGSYETKLYLPLGDIDLVVLSDSMAYSDKTNVLHALANTLKRANITSRVTIIAKAKVPIVKFITLHGRFNVDISINQANGVVSGGIINGFLKNMHGNGEGKGSLALRSLVMIVKAFLSQRSMNEVFTGGLGSYSIVCLAISFLQMHPKIRRGEMDPEKNLGVLVMEFFELYGCFFNYEEVGISVRDGGTYFSKRQRGWLDYYKSNLLSIEDPADPSNDISRGSYGLPKVRATFAGAFGILTSTAYLHAGILSSRRKGRTMRLGNRNESEDMSILSSIMGITQETINHRKLIQELYDKKTLHNLLGIKPGPSIVEAVNSSNKKGKEPGNPSSSSLRGAQSVKSAWREVDLVEHEEDYYSRRRDRDPHMEAEEGGRYDISRQSSSKRRKTGRQDDSRAVFTTDDEDDEYAVIDVGDEGNGGVYKKSPSVKDPEHVDKRRSYWLSKSIGISGGGYDSD